MKNSQRMPALFIGHGSPMNALQNNQCTQSWQRLGARLPRPRAILAVSAHWTTRGTAVTAMAAPPTIHDFGGFPQALFDIEYPAAGDPVLAARVRELLAPLPVQLDQSWGLDHGSWSVLYKMYPAADVPVLQLSIDLTQDAAFHLDLGRRLALLREEGMLILGSGNLVHNLRAVVWDGAAPAFDWALRFNRTMRDCLLADDRAQLLAAMTDGPDARLAVPTTEHFLPLLYALGSKQPDDTVTFFNDVVELGSIGMLSAGFGLPAGLALA
ncbi:4,5-DOPA dioxygenase extradiol [Herminiimonas sp. CN]|uniref:4,5-DOPA-extradiol-dioxygenase n=1 Tax=Herminiimonas sp. CN TaxID=1349818 RepID=UPI0004734760|nr:4,5-DOPA dioxygenase extradiol [Herminiimonas sp. CN]